MQYFLHKKIIYVLLFCHTLCMLKPYLPYADYFLGKDYVAKYCVNINKPALKCNGKCHLKKELKQSAQEENRTEKNVLKIKFNASEYLCNVFLFDALNPKIKIVKSYGIYLQCQSPTPFYLKLLRPPIFLLA